eukprot:4293327-Pleurochrysis_carterae.AAC.1
MQTLSQRGHYSDRCAKGEEKERELVRALWQRSTSRASAPADSRGFFGEGISAVTRRKRLR